MTIPELSYYLTPLQQRAYSRFSEGLQFFIQNKLLECPESECFEHSPIELIFEISKYSTPELQEVSEQFFLQLLQSRLDIKPYLEKVLAICQRKGFMTFFTFVSTKKLSYYSAETLLEIIQSFEKAFANQSAILLKVPCYEEGGKEKLKQLQVALLSQDEKFAKMEEKTALLLKLASCSYIDHLDSKTRIALTELVGSIRHGEISDKDLEEVIEKALQFYLKWGKGDFFLLSGALHLLRPQCCNEIIRALMLLKISANPDLVDMASKSLREFGKGKIALAKLIEQLEELISKYNQSKESVESLLLRFQGRDRNVVFPLAENHLKTIERQYESIEGYCKKWKTLRRSQLVELATSIRAKGEFREDAVLQLIAIGRLGLFSLFQVYLYNTQIFAILGQLCHENGCIAQVKTGEGKSFIITLLGFVLAMQNKSVHIISSSRSLATRDQEAAASFFHSFGITTSHISQDNAEKDRFSAQILYGTVFDFQFAVMREMLYLTPLFEQAPNSFKEKRFDCAIIDELDNLTIDTALNQARLSHPAEMTYEWIYAPILHFVMQAKQQQKEIYSSSLVEELRQMLQEYADGCCKEMVKTFSTDQLEQWIRSADRALSHEEDTDYIVSNQSTKQKHGITIVDAKNTGRLLHNSRWSKGVHEFVEAKHHIIPETESLLPISLSHFIFYPLYKALFGLTGTLGGGVEREEIKEFYGASSFDVPTHRPMMREDLLPKIFVSKELYLKTILDRVKTCKAQGRPILILCQSIRDSQEIETLLREENIPLEMLNEVQEKEEKMILSKAGYPGAITIATNTASRGTDIRLAEKSQDHGGLYVLLTFFPESQRIEDQARGRAGRQGQKGSSEIVVFLEGAETHFIDIDLPHVQAQLLYSLQEKRMSLARIMKQSHSCRAKMEHFIFSLVEDFFSHFRKFHEVLQDESFLTKWADVLSGRKIGEREIDLSQLKLKDHALAMEAIQLLTAKAYEPTKWKGLLKKAGERIKENVIAHWSMYFYQTVEELLINSRLENYAVLSERLQQTMDQILNSTEQGMEFTQLIFERLEEAVAKEKVEDLEQLKEKITNLYDQNQVMWKKYLDASGSGILCYLREITGASLKVNFSESPQSAHIPPIPLDQSATIQ